MKLLDAKVNWMQGWANDAQLEVTVDEIPKELFFRMKEVTDNGKPCFLFFGEKDGYVRYFCHDPQNQRGYGGSLYKLLMEDGATKEVKGPWSSRSGVMNAVGFTPSVEVTMYVKDGITPYAACLTVDKAKEAIKLIGDKRIGLKQVNRHDEPVWRITWYGKVKKPRRVQK